MPSPKRSFICVEKMVSAIPPVKPTITGYGTNFMMLPSLQTPISTSIMPAMIVAIISPDRPNSCIMP